MGRVWRHLLSIETALRLWLDYISHSPPISVRCACVLCVANSYRNSLGIDFEALYAEAKRYAKEQELKEAEGQGAEGKEPEPSGAVG